MGRESLNKRFKELFGEDDISENKLNNRQAQKSNFIRSIILFTFGFIKILIDFLIIGPSFNDTIKYIKNHNVYYFLSGLSMIIYSFIFIVYIQEIEKYLEQFYIFEKYGDILFGLITLFQLIQLIRGFSIINGYQIINFKREYKTLEQKQYNSNRYYSSIRNIEETTTYTPRYNKENYSEINEFKGYVNSKMSNMSNSRKEKYVRDLFGGKHK